MEKQKQKIIDQILLWTEEEVAEMLKQYGKKHHTVMKKELAKLYSSEMEQKLIENGTVSCCRNCGSIDFTKDGRNSHNQKFVCKDCNKDFTAVTGTFLQNSNLSWKAYFDLTCFIRITQKISFTCIFNFSIISFSPTTNAILIYVYL